MEAFNVFLGCGSPISRCGQAVSQVPDTPFDYEFMAWERDCNIRRVPLITISRIAPLYPPPQAELYVARG